MIIIILFIAIFSNNFQINRDIRIAEIYYKDGKVFQYNEIGRSSRRSDQLIHTFRVQHMGSFFHLQFDKVVEVTFELIKEKTITADILLSTGSRKTFEIIRDPYLCRTGDKIITLPLESIRKIKFEKP